MIEITISSNKECWIPLNVEVPHKNYKKVLQHTVCRNINETCQYIRKIVTLTLGITAPDQNLHYFWINFLKMRKRQKILLVYLVMSRIVSLVTRSQTRWLRLQFYDECQKLTHTHISHSHLTEPRYSFLFRSSVYRSFIMNTKHIS